MLQPIRLAVTLFSGFLQKNHSEASGLLVIDNQVRQLCNGRPEVRVSLNPWDSDESDIAEALWRLRPADAVQEHIVIGYSYGGDRAVKCCRELVKRGDVHVVTLVLIDPVVRWDWLPGVAASFGVGSHHVPDAVGEVIHFAQSSPRWKWAHGRDLFSPAGHPVVHRGKKVPPKVCGTSHTYIDNLQTVRVACLEVVERSLKRIP